jgi:hypothetical protein
MPNQGLHSSGLLTPLTRHVYGKEYLTMVKMVVVLVWGWDLNTTFTVERLD